MYTMDPIKIEKLQAMNKYMKKTQVLHALCQYFLTALVLSLLFSKSAYFSSLFSSLNTFLFVSIPSLVALMMEPKCLFFVSNVIVIVLVSESKLWGSSASSPASDLYDEYVRRNKRSLISMAEKRAEVEKNTEIEDQENEIEKGEEDRGDEEEEEKMADYSSGEEDQIGIPTEELNKRVEEFIAKINKQRMIEANKKIYSG